MTTNKQSQGKGNKSLSATPDWPKDATTVIRGLAAQRDELLEACKLLVNEIRNGRGMVSIKSALDYCDKAIAKTTAQTGEGR